MAAANRSTTSVIGSSLLLRHPWGERPFSVSPSPEPEKGSRVAAVRVASVRPMAVSLRDVTGLLDGWYDPAWAEPWDAVGLVCGDPDQDVRKILFAVDPGPAVVEEAKVWGADLVVAHHPLLLSAVHSVAATTPKGRIVHELMRVGIALFTAHTNADVPADGVNDSLARAVGIVDPTPVQADRDGTDKIVTFVPKEHAEAVRTALTAAGAGRIGDYDSATFSTPGGSPASSRTSTSTVAV